MSETFHFYSFIHINNNVESGIKLRPHWWKTLLLHLLLFICDYPFALYTYYNESNQEIQNLKVKKSQEAVEAYKKDSLSLTIIFCNKVINYSKVERT